MPMWEIVQYNDDAGGREHMKVDNEEPDTPSGDDVDAKRAADLGVWPLTPDAVLGLARRFLPHRLSRCPRPFSRYPPSLHRALRPSAHDLRLLSPWITTASRPSLRSTAGAAHPATSSATTSLPHSRRDPESTPPTRFMAETGCHAQTDTRHQPPGTTPTRTLMPGERSQSRVEMRRLPGTCMLTSITLGHDTRRLLGWETLGAYHDSSQGPHHDCLMLQKLSPSPFSDALQSSDGWVCFHASRFFWYYNCRAGSNNPRHPFMEKHPAPGTSRWSPSPHSAPSGRRRSFGVCQRKQNDKIRSRMRPPNGSYGTAERPACVAATLRGGLRPGSSSVSVQRTCSVFGSLVRP